ncbi:hypothetical protein [Pedobacter endophyticus]|uniref:Uncharacterized protein n=1 Tax=Pedobacter endophyticus TaxID=2789740 RepID=A0A7U3Q4E0_9SPHI|nr:hypothetical protein [Pedobacter endophyticus]QPH38401.1 hypothetical protein IZT61_15080 [Pedobacter endophyticus]
MVSNEKKTAAKSATHINATIDSTDEQIYLESLKRLLDAKRRGDWLLVAEMLGISAKNAELSFARIYSKYHNEVVDALNTVIKNRKKRLKKF